jgi:hypothetical protein
MRTLLICTTAMGLLGVVGGCKKQDETPPSTAPSATAAYPAYQNYPAPQPTYARAPAAPPPTYNQSPPPPVATQPPPVAASPAPVPTPSAAPGQMAVPGTLAFQCQNDVPCGTHHCNVAYGKCAFPCQSNVDCLAPNTCMMGFCVPAPITQPAPTTQPQR